MLGSKVYKIVNAMGVSSTQKVELVSYQLKNVAQVWFTQWKSNRQVEAGPTKWEEFKKSFLGKYFLIEEFIRLRQGSMSMEQ